MAKAEWGAKNTCVSCGVKFYDMGRSISACPSCDAPFTPGTARGRRGRKADVKVGIVGEPSVTNQASISADDEAAALIDDVDDILEDDDDDDAVVALEDTEGEDEDDVLAEADLGKNQLSDE